MLFRANVLNENEIKTIHKDSIRILEEVGVRVPSEKALAILEKAGAKINWDEKIAYISENMVDKALKTCPKKFTLGARNNSFDITLPSLTPTINMDGCGSYTIDYETRKRRAGTVQDLVNVAKVFDATPTAGVLWTCLAPEDINVSAEAAGIKASSVSFMNSCKHLQDEVKNIKELPYIIEMCKAIVGSKKDVIDRKIFSATYCTVAPLTHDLEMLEGTMALTEYEAPVLLYPMPACGSTGPASLYSNVALANAESLSSIVIFQLVKPGTPLIYGAALGKMNVKNGFFSEGTVETSLMMTAMGQLGKHYGLPTEIAGCLSDSLMLGAQAIMEKTLTTLPLVLNGVDIIQGFGLIESSMTLSLEQMIVDEEIFKQCLRMNCGIDVSPEKNYFEDIKEVGPGGDFLRQKNTRKAFRTDEFYISNMVSGEAYNTWLKNGGKDMYQYAHEKVQEILKADSICPMDYNTRAVIEEIVEDAVANL